MKILAELILGHRIVLKQEKTPEGHTHDFEVFVKSDQGNLESFVDSVIFHLHKSYPNPSRVVKEPPYLLKESGCAGFNLIIEILFKNTEEPRSTKYPYDLFLQACGPPISYQRKEKLIFSSPSEEFAKKLVKGGGVPLSTPKPAAKTSTTSQRNSSTAIQKSRMFRLFSHVPSSKILRTVLTEMENELRKNFPGARRKLTSQGQDACPITDLRDQDELEARPVGDYNEVIVKAKEAIALSAEQKIQNGDTILIYGYSEVIKDSILAAVENGKKFSLIIVENSLGYRSGSGNGRDMTQNGQEIHALHIMKYLAPKIKDDNVSVTHVHLSGLSFVIRTVTKLLLTAYALLTNGGILGRIGTAQIALMAHKKNIPVVVCCETFKFCDESPVDAFFQNQRGQLKTRGKKVNQKSQDMPATTPQKASEAMNITTMEETSYLKAPVLKYDITPAQFVTAVVTEVDIFPATSIPLLLSVQENRNKRKHGGKLSEGETEASRGTDKAKPSQHLESSPPAS